MRLPVVALLICAFALTLQAHDFPRSESKISVQGPAVTVQLRVNLLELRDTRWAGGEVVSYQEIEERIDALYASIKSHFRVESGAGLPRTALDRYELEDGHVLRMDLSFHFDREVSDLSVTSTLDQLMQPGHLHLTSVTMAGSVQQAVLDARAPRRQFVAFRNAYWSTAWSFLRLGITHIFTGYDHIALLVGLLIGTAGVGPLAKLVTSFTVAHTITLGLATFDLVILPTRVTESLIALSIAFLAVENLSGAGVANRWRVTFLFGLAHGFGFANVLREMQLPRAGMALSLFSFNSGVEIGQLMFAAVTFWALAHAAGMWRPLRPAVSAVVGSVAVYWFVQRAFTS